MYQFQSDLRSNYEMGLRPGRLRFLPESRFLLMGFLAIAFYFLGASINSGWLFMMSALIMSACLGAVLLPWYLLSHLEVHCTHAGTASAGERLEMQVSVSTKGLLPVAWLAVFADTKAKTISESGASVAIVEFVQRKQTMVTVPSELLKRGCYAAPPVYLETAYPFGFCFVRQERINFTEVLVYPKLVPVAGNFLIRLKSAVYVAGGSLSARNGFQSTTTRGARTYVRGDSPRFIHWSLSAKHSRLMVREFENEGLPAFDLLLDLTTRYATDELFERALCATYSVLALGHKLGIYPTLQVLRIADDGTIMVSKIEGLDLQAEFLATVVRTSRRNASSSELGANIALPEILSIASASSKALVLVSDLIEMEIPNNSFLLSIVQDRRSAKSSKEKEEKRSIFLDARHCLILENDDLLDL